MARLIDADKLKETIVGTVSEVAYNAPFDVEWFGRLADRQFEILRMIDQMPTVTDTNVGSKWIPVTERLPEKGEVVLACGKRHATSGMFQGASRNNPKLWHWKSNTLKEVTHWMPLPEPPKEVE